jgi:hypothetical protein
LSFALLPLKFNTIGFILGIFVLCTGTVLKYTTTPSVVYITRLFPLFTSPAILTTVHVLI